jgi:hypothetical protein
MRTKLLGGMEKSSVAEPKIFLSGSTPALHCKKRLSIFPSTAGMSLTKLSLAGKYLTIPGQREFG